MSMYFGFFQQFFSNPVLDLGYEPFRALLHILTSIQKDFRLEPELVPQFATK